MLEESKNSSTLPSKKTKRSYSQKTLKILFALSRNECTHPDCNQRIVESPTDLSGSLVVGEISHIYAASNDGPRGNSKMSEEERNHPDNLILFCPTHHEIVDGQHETYPATLLKGWKEDHERKFRDRMAATMNDIGYAELEITARALLSQESNGLQNDYTNLAPKEKIDRNSLGRSSTMLLKMGAAKSSEVGEVLVKAEQLDSGLPKRLRAGFVQRYSILKEEGLSGDDLFYSMYEWAGGNGDLSRQAAGLCILTHLFIICEVFEK